MQMVIGAIVRAFELPELVGPAASALRKVCTACAKGKVSGKGKATCTQCVPGRFADSRGLATCDACPNGKFQRSSGQPACETCAVGKYTPAPYGKPSCTVRQCPPNASGAPAHCHCRRDTYGAVHWSAPTRTWRGKCAAMPSGKASTLSLTSKQDGAWGRIKFASTTGELYVSASKCVDTRGLCNSPLPATASCCSSAPVVRTVDIAHGFSSGLEANIQLHADGVLSFRGAAGDCARGMLPPIASG